jgi:hypothetical protein
MTQVPVPAETAEYIARRVGAFREEAPEQLLWQTQHVAEFAALPLYIGWTETIGLRADGEIVRWSTEGEYIGVRPVEDQVWVRTGLVEGFKRYPGLKCLIPPRPPGAHTCPVCSGAGYPPSLPHIGCSCGGVGWIDAQSRG